MTICHPERSEGSLCGEKAEMLRGVYPERSEGLSTTCAKSRCNNRTSVKLWGTNLANNLATRACSIRCHKSEALEAYPTLTLASPFLFVSSLDFVHFQLNNKLPE